MRARMVAVGGAVLMAGMAAPAGAAQIGIVGASTGPVPAGPRLAVLMEAAPGEANDVTVRASRPGPVLSGGSALTVTVTDPSATFVSTPPAGATKCRITDPHTAKCIARPGKYFQQVVLGLGDGNDRLRFAPSSIPLREQFVTGTGDDDIVTGPFQGDASYRWASDTGPGDDRVVIGPSVSTPAVSSTYAAVPGLALWTGAGNDTIAALNGAADLTSCGDGVDTVIADPFDRDTVYSEPPGSCETRLLPAGP
jgi:hypothetical protein